MLLGGIDKIPQVLFSELNLLEHSAKLWKFAQLLETV